MRRPPALVLALAAIVSSLSCSGGSAEQNLLANVVSVSPPDGATLVSVSQSTVTVQMDKAMDPSTVNPGTVFVNESGTGGLVLGSVAYQAATRRIVWTLAPGQNLNPLLPGQDVLAFDRFYTITLTNGVRTTTQVPIFKAPFNATFRTGPVGYTVVAAQSDPAPGATNALIDPAARLVGGNVVLATLAIKIDIPLDPATVTPTGNVAVAQGLTSVPGTTAFDAAANTILWTPDGTLNPNPGFPGEPLLRTATAYVLTISTAVKTAGSGLAPSAPVSVPFTTAALAIRSPGASSSVLDLKLNEVFPNPGTTTANGDSNGDAAAVEPQDEFVEIVNVSNAYIDMTGCIVHDATTITASNPAWFTFNLPAGQRHLALIAPGRAILIFGGGAPSAARRAAGRTKVHAGAAGTNPSSSRFNNGSSSSPPGTVVDTVRVTLASTNLMLENYVEPVPNGASITRNPDVTGALVDHSTVTPGTNFTPGTKVGGQPFP